MLISRWSGAAVGPDKSRYRTSAVLELQMSGNRVNQDARTQRGDRLNLKVHGPSSSRVQRRKAHRRSTLRLPTKTCSVLQRDKSNDRCVPTFFR